MEAWAKIICLLDKNQMQDLPNKFSPPLVSQFHILACFITIFTAYLFVISL
jgi:hypothetical protein